MKTANTPPVHRAGLAARIGRAWRGYRRWRRGRPFTGGLLSILAGIEIFGSANLQLGSLEVHFGPEGFQSYMIPVMILLCGVLTWITPGQRLFYGIVGTVVAVYSLIGVNLGGFVIGMLLGIVGGALTAAWTPDRRAEPLVTSPPSSGFPDDVEPATAHAQPFGSTPPAEETELIDYGRPPDPVRRSFGGAGSADDERPDPDERWRSNRYIRYPTLAVVALLTGAFTFTLAVVELSRPAAAAPAGCVQTSGTGTPRSSSSTKVKAPASPSKSPYRSSAPQVPPAGSPSSIATAAAGGDAQAVAAGAAGDPAASSTASSSGGATATQTATQTASRGSGSTVGRSTSSRTASAAASTAPPCPGLTILADGQPDVNEVPSHLTADRLALTGLTYDGVVDLPTHSGTLRVLKFSMAQSVSTNFQLVIPRSDRMVVIRTPELTIEDNVVFFATEFSGTLPPPLGSIRVTYTPEAPPLLVPPLIAFTDANIRLAFVSADNLRAPDLTISLR